MATKYTRKIASAVAIKGLLFFALGFLVFPDATVMFRTFAFNPFVVIGFILLGIGLMQPLFEKMQGKKR